MYFKNSEGNVDWDNVWGTWLMLLVVTLSCIALTGITSNHRVRYYYLQSGSSSTCVMGDIDWGQDITSYCSDDISKTLMVLEKAQGTIK